MRLGVDARPLESPNNGIGRYTTEILSQIAAKTDWHLFLYTSEPLVVPWSSAKVIPIGARLGSRALAFATLTAAQTARDDIDCFFAPRHHLPLNLSTKSVVTIHDLVWKHARWTMRPLGWLVEALLMPRAIRQSTAIVAVSEHTAQSLNNEFPGARGKVRVIHEAAFEHEAGTTRCRRIVESYLLGVGTQEPRKNYTRLLQAFRSVHRSHPDLKLVIAGRRGWRTRLAETIESLHLENHVVVIDDASDEDLLSLYEHCECFVFPSLYEGFGLPLLEAMSFGKPIVASDVSAIPQVLGGAGVLVDPLDVDSIAEGVLRVLADSDLSARLGRDAKRRACEFSWDTAGDATIELIRASAR